MTRRRLTTRGAATVDGDRPGTGPGLDPDAERSRLAALGDVAAGAAVADTRVATALATLTAAPPAGPAPAGRRIGAAALHEIRATLRNGEQLLLTMIIPVMLLLGATRLPIGRGDDPLASAAPAVIGLAVMSTAFTGLAIGTGFERRYGVLRRLGVTPLGRRGLVAAKSLAALGVIAVQVVVVVGVAAALGWRPDPGPWALPATVALVLLAGTAFAGLGLLMAGTLRAEATLAAANLLYLLMLVGGGVVVPLDSFPDAVGSVLAWTPLGALVEGLQAVLRDAAGVPWQVWAALTGWAAAAVAAAATWFRWD